MKNLLEQQKQIIQNNERLLDRHIGNTTSKLRKQYKRLSATVIEVIESLLNDIRKQEDSSLSNYINYHRYYSILTDIGRECNKLAKLEKEILEEEMVELYMLFYALEPLAGEGDLEKAHEAVDGVWVSDGKHWQERVNEHSAKLYSRLDQIITDSIVSNIPEEEVVREVKKFFDQAFNEDKTLIDTEYSHIMNRVLDDKYEQNKIQYARFVCYHTDTTCGECLQRDGDIFRVGDPLYSIPRHPNCMCCSIPLTNNNIYRR